MISTATAAKNVLNNENFYKTKKYIVLDIKLGESGNRNGRKT